MWRYIAMSCERGLLRPALEAPSVLMWILGGISLKVGKECVQKGDPYPEETTVRERCLAENCDAPDQATVKDFSRFVTVTGGGAHRPGDWKDHGRLPQHIWIVVLRRLQPRDHDCDR